MTAALAPVFIVEPKRKFDRDVQRTYLNTPRHKLNGLTAKSEPVSPRMNHFPMMGRQPWDQNFWPGTLPEYRPCPAECAPRDPSWSAPYRANRPASCETPSGSRACGNPGKTRWQWLFPLRPAIPQTWVAAQLRRPENQTTGLRPPKDRLRARHCADRTV